MSRKEKLQSSGEAPKDQEQVYFQNFPNCGERTRMSNVQRPSVELETVASSEEWKREDVESTRE